MAKFSKLNFPISGLIKAPYKVEFRPDSIVILKAERGASLLADYYPSNMINTTHLQRLINIDSLGKLRVTFDFTVRNMEELIHSKIKWGIDLSGKVLDFSKIERFKAQCTAIKKQKDNLLWVKTVSYPFELNKYLNLDIDASSIYVQLININRTWYIYKFSYEYLNDQYIDL